jgi:hypothetical protein
LDKNALPVQVLFWNCGQNFLRSLKISSQHKSLVLNQAQQQRVAHHTADISHNQAAPVQFPI